MGACPSDVSGFRFYEEYDLEKGTPVSACSVRVLLEFLLQTVLLASTHRASGDLWALGFQLTPKQLASCGGLCWGR